MLFRSLLNWKVAGGTVSSMGSAVGSQATTAKLLRAPRTCQNTATTALQTKLSTNPTNQRASMRASTKMTIPKQKIPLDCRWKAPMLGTNQEPTFGSRRPLLTDG